MSKSNSPREKRTDSQQTVLSLVQQVERGRRTVRRVREHLDGERDASRVKPADWFATIDYVRDELGVELVLYRAEDGMGVDSASIFATDDDGRTLHCAYNEVNGHSGPTHWFREDAEEVIRHTSPDLLPIDDAKARLQRFAEVRE